MFSPFCNSFVECIPEMKMNNVKKSAHNTDVKSLTNEAIQSNPDILKNSIENCKRTAAGWRSIQSTWYTSYTCYYRLLQTIHL